MTEHVTAEVSRAEVREQLERHLDQSRPREQQAKSWGREIDVDQFARMKAAQDAAVAARLEKRRQQAS